MCFNLFHPCSGLDYSSPWHDNFIAAQEFICQNLHITHPSMQAVLRMCQDRLGKMIIVDLSGQRALGPVECEHLKVGEIYQSHV